MAANYFGITDTGRMRDNNEDAFIAEKVLDNRFIMACVIDGVGGYEGGEVAAAIARQTLLQYFSVLSGDVLTMMREAMLAANEKIYAEKLQNRKLQHMACVVTMALADIKNNRFYYAHVGDTRLYLLRDQTLVKVTKDHSFVGFLEDSGRLSEEAAMRHPKRNEIDKALGFDPQLSSKSDYIETGESPFLPGDIILLCSDGLSDLVNNAEMTAVLTSNGTLEQKAQELVMMANDKGGKDNITVVVVQNDTVSKKQKATKPVAPVKKNDSPENKQIREEAERIVEPQIVKRSNKGVAALSILCFVLLAALLWSLFRSTNVEKPAVTDTNIVVPKERNPQEQMLVNALHNSATDTLVLSDSLAGKSILLSDTLHVQKDSFYINGNGTIWARDSSFAGPALAVAPASKFLMLENLTLQDFDVAISAPLSKIHFKNVQFKNCRIPVQYNLSFPDTTIINSTINGIRFIKKDSLPHSTTQTAHGSR
ncbi:MAG: protein phosphatase 2C domain-containing protein [Bacteroidota bacterium]|nr:protein phosphatase 2C domain-containing protein [Bacteroidota bacterium]